MKILNIPVCSRISVSGTCVLPLHSEQFVKAVDVKLVEFLGVPQVSLAYSSVVRTMAL